jgi:hypothetical protein
MQEAEAKAAASEEKERSINERLSQSSSRITVLETQVCVLISSETKTCDITHVHSHGFWHQFETLSEKGSSFDMDVGSYADYNS